MVSWGTRRWVAIGALVVLFDVGVYFLAVVVFTFEHCGSPANSDYWKCGSVRDLARWLLYATPVVTVAAGLAAVYARWAKRR